MTFSSVIKKATIAILCILVFIIVSGGVFYVTIPPYATINTLSGEGADGHGIMDLGTPYWTAGTKGNSLDLKFTVGKGGIPKGGSIKISTGHVMKVGEKRKIYVPFDLSLIGLIFFDINLVKDATVATSGDAVLETIPPSKLAIFRKYIGAGKFKTTQAGHQRDNLVQSIDRETGLVIRVKEGRLEEGDILKITLGDRKIGQGLTAPHRATRFQVIARTDGNANGTFDLIDGNPGLDVVVPLATRFNVVTQFNPDPGKPVDLLVVAMDDFYLPNRVMPYTGTIRFSSDHPVTNLPDAYTFKESDRGIKRFSVTFPQPGLYRITVADDNGATGTSHYIDTRHHAKKIWFGDMHIHSVLSYDAGRETDFVFRRQRDIDGYDFSCLTDHDLIGTVPPMAAKDHVQGMEADEWQYTRDLADQYNDPGRYVTLKGYEWTNYPDGHRNVHYAPDIENPPLFCWAHKESDTAEELINLLSAYDDLVIPHSPAWKTGKDRFDWGPADKQGLVEIYSTHGASEFYNNPMAVHEGKKEIPTDNWLIKKILMYDIDQASEHSGNFVRDALARGRKFGFIGSGDIHYLGYINQAYQTGMAAAFAEELTRNGIWGGLKARETYATTGARIGIRFSCNNSPMGSEIPAAPPRFKGEILGTAPIRTVELVKFNGTAYETISLDGAADGRDIIRFDHTDTTFNGKGFYYLRVTQTDGNMAWASPIWLE